MTEFDPLADALLAAQLCAIDSSLGGMILRGGGDYRDAVIAALDLPVRRIPVHIDDERLLGGLDLTATLASGSAVTRAGLLAEADGGAIILPIAERLSTSTAGRIAAAIDAGEAQFLTILLDDGIENEERAPAALAERVAFWIDLTEVRAAPDCQPATVGIQSAPLPSQANIETVSKVAAVFGIDSARASSFALRAARASAAFAGREHIGDEDILFAVRTVLAPRATQIPADDEPEAVPSPPKQEQQGDGEQQQQDLKPPEDLILAAALAALPKDVLSRIAAGRGSRAKVSRTTGNGQKRKSAARGRPLGARAGMPGGGMRLSLIDTLRAAAPWQKVRGRDGRVLIRKDDLRIRRFETRAEAVTIFAVDASGSSALARLAEAKGAVELLLAEAYVKRAQVALVAFRGTAAELLLPPTRSLTRARRSLAELPGGGGTPLAAGLKAAHDLADGASRKGRTPFLIVLTDGRANIALDGTAVRGRAESDATAAAKAIGHAGIAAAFVDISPRPRLEGAALAAAMGARYLPLPRADAAAMHSAVRTAQGE